MFHVIRNGDYIITDTLELNDIQVDPRPDINAIYINYEWVTDPKKEQKCVNVNAKQYLTDTDWMVIRHRDQIALCIETNLSEEEYRQLLEKRQKMRERVTDYAKT